MWTITSLIDLWAVPGGAQGYVNDGLPVVNTTRKTTGSSYRLMIAPLGYVDMTDMDYGLLACGDDLGGVATQSAASKTAHDETIVSDLEPHVKSDVLLS